jgi:hypothetical protein
MITHFWHLSFYVLHKGLKPFAEVDEFNGLLIFVLIKSISYTSRDIAGTTDYLELSAE